MPNDAEFDRNFSQSYERDPHAGFVAEKDFFNPDPPPRRIRIPWKAIFGIAAIGLIATPIAIGVNDVLAWRDAPTALGKVVETRPEGPFPEEMTIEYVASDEVVRRVVIRWNYTTARAVGEDVELVYRAETPDAAMTRIQTQDEGWSYSPYAMFGSIGLGMFCLTMAFPNHIRTRVRPNKS